MFGHKWEPARGTIVESRIEAADGSRGAQQRRIYVVDVRSSSGEMLRATVQSPHDPSTELSPGVSVRLEVNAKTAEVRFDPSQPAPTAHGASAREATRRARELQGQAAGPTGSVGFSSPEAPSAFGSASQAMPPATTFSSPADSFGTPTSSVGPPGGSVSFSSPPVAPASFGPVTPNGTSRSATGGSSFGAGGSDSPFGQDSKADRIGRLEDQHDRGQLTEQQFATQRQQIMDEF